MPGGVGGRVAAVGFCFLKDYGFLMDFTGKTSIFHQKACPCYVIFKWFLLGNHGFPKDLFSNKNRENLSFKGFGSLVSLVFVGFSKSS